MNFLIALVLNSSICAASEPPQPAAWKHTLEMVSMRDGVKLATHIWFPTGTGPWPVVVSRTPYDGSTTINQPDVQRLLANGYCVVGQDVRGRFLSEGSALAFTPDGGDHRDGYDTIEWVAKQSWCNGKVGAFGGSGSGIPFVMMAAGGGAPPSLACQHLQISMADLFGSYVHGGEVHFPGLNWLEMAGWDLNAHLQSLKDRPVYDSYWRLRRLDEAGVHPDVPTFSRGGWFDSFCPGSIDTYTVSRRQGGPKAKNNQILILGPWPHGIDWEFGLARLAPDARTYPLSDVVHYFDHYLKGAQNEFAHPKPVHYYTIGDITDPTCPLNRWRTADDWPMPCEYTPMYIHDDGSLALEKPAVDGRPKSYIYDPMNPVPTIGHSSAGIPIGPVDNRELEARPDVLVYTSKPIAENLEMTGRIKVTLFVSSSCKDTDFTAKLCDVYPDGRSINIADSIVRMRFDKNLTVQRELEPGRIYKAEIDLRYMSWVFQTGHCIRLDISSSNYPEYEKNPNTGDFFPLSATHFSPALVPNPDWKCVRARNTVFADQMHASCVVLPIVRD